MSSNWRNVALLKNEFVFRGISHQYDEVSSIHFYDKVVTTYINGIPVGKSYAINLTVSLENVHEPLCIQGTCRSPLLAILGGVPKHIEPIRELYGHFATRTFEKRAKKYLDQIARNSEFIYDSKIFKVSGQVIDGMKMVDFSKAKILREPFLLKLSTTRPASLLDKVKQRIFSPDIRVSTFYDQDVFYALLAKLYNVHWK